jgi:transaldolase
MILADPWCNQVTSSGWSRRAKSFGVTTNPTIFAKSIGAGSGYTEQLQELALRGTAVGEPVRLLTAWDVRVACDVLHPVYERSGRRDGRVSIEVDPRISGDAERTAAEARGLWWLVAPKSVSGLHCIPHATPTLKPHQGAENDSAHSISIF